MALLVLHTPYSKHSFWLFTEIYGSLNMQTKFMKNANFIYNVPKVYAEHHSSRVTSCQLCPDWFKRLIWHEDSISLQNPFTSSRGTNWRIHAVHTYLLNTHATQLCPHRSLGVFSALLKSTSGGLWPCTCSTPATGPSSGLEPRTLQLPVKRLQSELLPPNQSISSSIHYTTLTS